MADAYVMKSSASYEKEVEQLRKRKTAHWEREEYQQCDTLTRKIIESWAAYHKAKEREERQCSNT